MMPNEEPKRPTGGEPKRNTRRQQPESVRWPRVPAADCRCRDIDPEQRPCFRCRQNASNIDPRG